MSLGVWHRRHDRVPPARTPEPTALFGNRFLTEAAPSSHFPDVGHDPDGRDAPGRPRTWRWRATRNRNLATFVTTWMEPEAQRIIAENLHTNFIDHAEYPDLRRDRAALRADAGRPVPRPGRDHRLPDPGLVRGDHARRAVAEVEVEGAPRGRAEAPGRPAQPGLRRRRARGVGEVLPLLRRGAADHPAGGGQVHDRPRRRRAAPRREHDRRRRRPRYDVHRPHGRHHRASTSCSST